jgi:hypothetical protein
MIAELHLRGYQQLRVVPHLYHLGTWRCGITPRSNTLRVHGAMAKSWHFDILPQYTSASERDYFGWTDRRTASPSELADPFVDRFPRVAAAGMGEDFEYAGWYSWMLHLTFPGLLPISMAEYMNDYTALSSVGLSDATVAPVSILLPPAGRAEGQLFE